MGRSRSERTRAQGVPPAPGRRGSHREVCAAALQWIGDGRIEVDGLYRRADPRDCQRIYDELLRGEAENLFTVFDWTLL